ncbi:MAG: hypothetical protein WC261_06880 [Synergistaceae bacterium]|jgi:predicted transglutaminase-like cysteine proteinase
MPSTQLINQFVSQTLFLQAVGTTVKLWIPGNGISAYTIQSASLSQGSVLVPVKVNGHTGFQVPALGRWSDYISTTGFTLPGNVTLTICVLGEVPIFDLTSISVSQPNIVENIGSGTVVLNSTCASLSGWEQIVVGGEPVQDVIANTNGFLFDATAIENGVVVYCGCGIDLAPHSALFSVALAVNLLEGDTCNFFFAYHVISGYMVTLSLRFGSSQNGLFLSVDGDPELIPATAGLVKQGELQTWRVDYDGHDRVAYIYLNGVFIAESDFIFNYGGTGSTGQLRLEISRSSKAYLRSISIIESIVDRAEMTHTATISVLDNSLIADEDTITISVGSDQTILTFVNIPSSLPNEIVIGSTKELTAVNIATAFNLLAGAIFTATTQLIQEKGFEWREGITYTTADTFTRHNNILYACIANHVAASTNEPAVGSEWATFWTALATCPDWSAGVFFAASTESVVVACAHAGYIFMCTAEHTSAFSDEPLVGANYESYWQNTFVPVVENLVAPYVSIIAFTSETVTITTALTGLTVGAITESFSSTTSEEAATLPAFTGNGFCADGTAFLPAFTGAGTCTQDDFCIGRGVLPAATCNAQSFITGVSYSSTDAEKISLLLYGNGWMQNFAGMVGIASEPDASALLAVQFVANYITYAPDLTTWSVADYWIDPRATLYYATGDCEDGAFLLASILLNLGVSHTKVRVAIGTYNGVGHAWVLYQRDSDGLWVLLDWTAGATYWNAISDIDDLSIAYSTSGYNPTEYVTAYYVSDVASVTSSVFMYDNALTAWLQVVTEALEFADSVTRGLGIGIHDWLTLKDTQANNWNGKETVPDALMLYDLATGYQRYSVSVVDSLDIADAATRALLIAVLEKLHFTDLAGMIATISKTATDSLDLTDFAGNTYLDTITEALSLVDVASILKTTYGVVSEALAFADTLSGYRNLPLSATSTLTLSETVSAKGTFYRAVYDTIIMNVMVELAGEVYECYVLNTPKFLPSMYSGFNFNSYCVFENRAFAANGTGIYELTGDTDAGTAIHSGVLMHNSDFGAPHQKRFRRGYLGISGGSPVMVLETEDGGRLAYTIDNNGKAVFSHEQKSKKWTLSVSDFDELDSIKLIPVILSR